VDTSKKSILIVDSETKIRDFLGARLVSIGYKIFSSTNGAEAMVILNKEDIDLIILEVMLPKLDGYEVCRRIRQNSHIPIIILTALDSMGSRLIGLELGADDFVTKPFSLKELEIRIYSVLRRSDFQKFKGFPTRQEIFHFGSLTVNLTKQQVLKNNKQIILTVIEFRLLKFLIQNAGYKLSRITILDNLWGYKPERDIDTRIVDVHIHRLRTKLEENPKKPDFILTARGIGYMFQTLNV